MCQTRIGHCSQLPPGHVPPSLPLCLGDSLPDVIATPLSALSRVVASRRRGTAASHSTEPQHWHHRCSDGEAETTGARPPAAATAEAHSSWDPPDSTRAPTRGRADTKR